MVFTLNSPNRMRIVYVNKLFEDININGNFSKFNHYCKYSGLFEFIQLVTVNKMFGSPLIVLSPCDYSAIKVMPIRAIPVITPIMAM